LEQKSSQLTDSLVVNVRTFESMSNARNYRALLVSQIKVVDNWIEAKQGLKGAEGMVRDLENSKRNLETCLNTVDKVVGNRVAAATARHGVPVPPQPAAQQRPPRRQGRGMFSGFPWS